MAAGKSRSAHAPPVRDRRAVARRECSFSARRKACGALCRGAACDQRTGHCLFYRRCSRRRTWTGFSKERLSRAGAFQHPLSYLYSVFYIPRAIRSSLKLLVALNPKDEYPEARAMQRHFILHTGGTNTGKTYAGFERLRKSKTGVYLAPLRLLALEAQERLLDLGVACSLTTGEEEDRREGDTHVAATAEKLDLSARYDVAVIDECQMIADRERGFAWTRAILGVLAPEVHLCAAPEARDLLIRIIESTRRHVGGDPSSAQNAARVHAPGD